MARGTLNKVMLIGRLGGDPEIRTTANGNAVANFNMATNSDYKDNQTNEWHETTEWHRVVFFGRTAEVVRDYLRKGSLVYVEGRIQTQKWQDQNGIDRYTTKVFGERMDMLGGRSDNAGGGGYPQPPAQQNYTPPAQNTGYAPPPQNTGTQYTPPPQNTGAQYTPPPPNTDTQPSYTPPPPNTDTQPSYTPPPPNPTPTAPPAPADSKPASNSSDNFDDDIPF